MGAQEQDTYEPSRINPWRQPPTREQMRFAIDLCRTELPDPQPTIAGLRDLSRYEMSNLIRSLKIMRAQRLRKAPRNARWRLAPMGRRR